MRYITSAWIISGVDQFPPPPQKNTPPVEAQRYSALLSFWFEIMGECFALWVKLGKKLRIFAWLCKQALNRLAAYEVFWSRLCVFFFLLLLSFNPERAVHASFPSIRVYICTCICKYTIRMHVDVDVATARNEVSWIINGADGLF